MSESCSDGHSDNHYIDDYDGIDDDGIWDEDDDDGVPYHDNDDEDSQLSRL